MAWQAPQASPWHKRSQWWKPHDSNLQTRNDNRPSQQTVSTVTLDLTLTCHTSYHRTPSPASSARCQPSSFHKRTACSLGTDKAGTGWGLRGKRVVSSDDHTAVADGNTDIRTRSSFRKGSADQEQYGHNGRPSTMSSASQTIGSTDKTTTYLFKRAPETGRTGTAVVPLLAVVVAAAQRLPADQITLMHPCLIHQSNVSTRSLLALALGQAGKRSHGAAEPGALMAPTGPEGTTRALAEDLRVGTTLPASSRSSTGLIFRTTNLRGGGTAPAWADEHDRARRTRTGMTLRRADVLTSIEWLHAGRLAGRDRIGTRDTDQECARREEGSGIGHERMLAAWTMSDERWRVGAGRGSE